MEFMSYADGLLSVAVISIFMAISPGADFAMVTRNSVFHGRKAGLFSAVGISMAIWIHVAYSIAGLAVIISQSLVLFSILKYLGAAYLLYIGWQTFKASAQELDEDKPAQCGLTRAEALRIGFITNALNPKTTVFFLSIFTQVVHPETPLGIQMVYGLIISLAHLGWFSLVVMLLTHPPLLVRFQTYRRGIERAVGTVLMAFGLKVATAGAE